MKKRKRRKMTLHRKRQITGYIFILPLILGFFMFLVNPLVESLQMSFSNVKLQPGQGGFVLEPVGFANYEQALAVDPEFNRLIVEEITQMLIDVPSILIFSFLIAILLNQAFKGRGLVRAIFFLPVILSSGVIVGLDAENQLLQEMGEIVQAEDTSTSITGYLETILGANDTNSMMGQYMAIIFDVINHIYDIAIASGIQIIIFLTALQSISASTFEAAKIEGCDAWACFWKITLPMVSPMILVNFIYTVVDFFVKSDSEVMTKITDAMMADLNYGFSSAMAWIYFAIIIVILGVCTAIISKKVFYYE
ncbi:ABC transporter permease [Candidatus Epulonipiscioides gigas]|nr:ABC transporter permease [Epulopiscium sp. SCG-C07WGA-EpuloA2]